MSTNDAMFLVTFTAAIATTWFKGKQWPTLVTGSVFGCFLGATAAGGKITDGVAVVVNFLLSLAHMG